MNQRTAPTPPPVPRVKPRAAKMVAPPRIAIQAARLHRFRPDAAAIFESLFDDLLAEMVPPEER